MNERFSPLRVAVIYAVFGAAWILFSDSVLHALVQNADLENRLQTAKGWLFIGVTGGLVFWLTSRLANELNDNNEERKEALEALRESRDQMRLVTDNLPVLIGYLDQEGRYRSINKTVESWFARPADQILGRTAREVLGQDAHEAVWPNVEAALKGTEQNIERVVSFPDSRTRNVDITYVPDIDESGSVRGCFALALDITKRKRAEEALAESEARFRAFVEHAPEAITMLDVDTGLYVDANPRAETLHGLGREKLINKIGPADLSPEYQPDGRLSTDAARDYLKRALHGEFPKFEWMHVTPDGKETLCEVSLVKLPDPQRNLVRASIADITERKAADERLRQAQKMEAVGQLTGGVAHDFNNLLAVMSGHAEMLELRAGDDDQLLSGLGAIRRSVMRGASLTQRLLAFSRKQPLMPISADIAEMAHGLEELFQRTLGETIDLNVGFEEDLWAATVDPNQLENAMLNLAINARDAMPDGGTLSIRGANVVLGDAHAGQGEDILPGDYVQISVSDTGCGMTRENLKKAIEPFFTTKGVGKGSGLGLSMVYGFAKQSGGHMAIDSEVGRGTTVKLFLPRSQDEVSPIGVTDAIQPPAGGSEWILVVEDDPNVREIPVTTFLNQGYQVIEAADGEAAIACLREGQRIDLIFTDLVLPGGMNGVEIAKEAKRIQPNIKVIYATGYVDNEVMKKGELEPGATLVSKPYELVRLLKLVRDVLDGVA